MSLNSILYLVHNINILSHVTYLVRTFNELTFLEVEYFLPLHRVFCNFCSNLNESATNNIKTSYDDKQYLLQWTIGKMLFEKQKIARTHDAF